jgi:hypothetical protein
MGRRGGCRTGAYRGRGSCRTRYRHRSVGRWRSGRRCAGRRRRRRRPVGRLTGSCRGRLLVRRGAPVRRSGRLIRRGDGWHGGRGRRRHGCCGCRRDRRSSRRRHGSSSRRHGRRRRALRRRARALGALRRRRGTLCRGRGLGRPVEREDARRVTVPRRRGRLGGGRRQLLDDGLQHLDRVGGARVRSGRVRRGLRLAGGRWHGRGLGLARGRWHGRGPARGAVRRSVAPSRAPGGVLGCRWPCCGRRDGRARGLGGLGLLRRGHWLGLLWGSGSRLSGRLTGRY